MTEAWNPRYLAYCRAHGRGPDEQLAHDRIEWSGGSMVGFILWHRKRIQEAYKEIPHVFVHGTPTDHEAYDAWLNAWVDRHLAQKEGQPS